MERQAERTLGQEIHIPSTTDLNPQIIYSSDRDTDIDSGGLNAEGTGLSPRSYSASIFGGTSSHGSHTTDTRQALSQVLMSFQEVAIDRPFDDASFELRVDNLSSTAGSNGSSNYLTIDGPTDGPGRPRALSDLGPHPEIPSRPLVTHEGPLIHGGDVSITMNDLVTVPRVLPRRRYTTRDYSSRLTPSNDWLRHPDVVAFSISNSVPSVSITRDNEADLDHDEHDPTLENQENIPPHPTFIPNQRAVPNTVYMNSPGFDSGFPPPPVASTPHTPQINRARALSSQRVVQAQNSRLLQEHGDVVRMIEALGVSPLNQTASEHVPGSTSQVRTDNEQDHGPTPVNARCSSGRDSIAACCGLSLTKQSYGSLGHVGTSPIWQSDSTNNIIWGST
jgi:hypothetical protein